MLPLNNLLYITTKSATFNTYNATKLVLHVSAYFQYVSHIGAPCKPSDDLISFQYVVWEHLKYTGMDSIAYLRDPTDGTAMTNVVKTHARYMVQSAKLLGEVQVQLYNKHDRTNNMAARAYLLASLSSERRNKVTEKLDDVPTPSQLCGFRSSSPSSQHQLKGLKTSRVPSSLGF